MTKKKVDSNQTPKARITRAEFDWREKFCYDMHQWGYSNFEIWEYCCNGGVSKADPKFKWGVSERMISQYISNAKKRKDKLPTIEDRTILLQLAKQRWESMLKISHQSNNLENMRLCQKELDRLNGLEVININLTHNDLRNKTDEELIAELKTLKD